MDFMSLMGVANFGLNALFQYEQISLQNQANRFYNLQAKRNREIGKFNSDILIKAGAQNIKATIENTRAATSSQRVEFARRGIELEGSPDFILEATYGEGLKQAQNILENTKNSAQNAIFAGEASASANVSQANQALFGSISNSIQMGRDMLNFFQSTFSQPTQLNSQPMRSLPSNAGILPGFRIA